MFLAPACIRLPSEGVTEPPKVSYREATHNLEIAHLWQRVEGKFKFDWVSQELRYHLENWSASTILLFSNKKFSLYKRFQTDYFKQSSNCAELKSTEILGREDIYSWRIKWIGRTAHASPPIAMKPWRNSTNSTAKGHFRHWNPWSVYQLLGRSRAHPPLVAVPHD